MAASEALQECVGIMATLQHTTAFTTRSYKKSLQLWGKQRVSCDQEYGACSDDVSCQPNVDYEWREWHECNDCSATCDGLRHRSRHVALQGSRHGKFCTDVAEEVQNCCSSSGCEGAAKVNCQWSEWNSWPSCSVTCGEGQYNRSVFRDGEEAKTSFFVSFGGDHSMSDYIDKGMIDTGCSRFLIGQNTLEKWEQMLTRRWGLSTQRIQLAKAMTFRFGNDETLETRTVAFLPVGIAGVNGVLRVYVVPGGAPLLLSKEFSRDLGCHIDLGRGHLFFVKLGVRTVVTSKQVAAFASTLDEFWATGTQDPG